MGQLPLLLPIEQGNAPHLAQVQPQDVVADHAVPANRAGWGLVVLPLRRGSRPLPPRRARPGQPSAMPAAPRAGRLLAGAAGGGGGALVLLSHRLLPCVPARAAQRTSGPDAPGPLCRRPPLVRL